MASSVYCVVKNKIYNEKFSNIELVFTEWCLLNAIKGNLYVRYGWVYAIVNLALRGRLTFNNDREVLGVRGRTAPS